MDQDLRAHDAFRRTTAFSSLDGLRCLSILAVCWHHAGSRGGVWRGYDLGFLGVDLFFVISGFLIVTLLLREHDATRTISLRKFYIRRTLRIFPLYYAVIVALAVLYALTHSQFGTRYLRELPYYLTYTADFHPVVFGIVWSLSAEEQFYLIWPSVEKYFGRFCYAALGILIGLNQLSNFTTGRILIADMLGAPGFPELSIAQVTFTPILLGVTVAHMLHTSHGFGALRIVAGRRWHSSLWLLTLAGLLTCAPEDISGLPRLAMQLSMTLLLASCVYREDHALRPIFAFSLVQRIGKVSYGLYLFHVLVIAALRHFLQFPADGSMALYFATLILTLCIAELSFRFFETPLLTLKRRYSVVHQDHV